MAGGGEACVGLVDVHRGVELVRPGERAVDLLPLFERVPGPDPVTLDADGHVGPQADRQPGAARVGAVAVVCDGPLGGEASVVEEGFTGELEVDFARHAESDANERVIGVFVGRGAGVGRDGILAVAGSDGEGVAYEHPAGGRGPSGGEGVGPGLVDARGGHVDPEGAEPKRAGLTVEERAEDGGSVEARHAQPVDRPVGRDERAGVAVGEERVVGDRRERRGRGCALRRGIAHRTTDRWGALRGVIWGSSARVGSAKGRWARGVLPRAQARAADRAGSGGHPRSEGEALTV